ncbi:MAG: c-type cytochrome [Nannocystaceae bacterium]
MRAIEALGSAVLVLGACGREPTPVSDPVPEDQVVLPSPEDRTRESYLADAKFRRAALEDSLANPDNGYSRDRLAAYGLADAGWELLPAWNPRVVPLTTAIARRMRSGELALPPATNPLWNGTATLDLDGWRELGRRVFFEYPLRADDSIAHALLEPERAAARGLTPASDGSYPGLVVFEDLDGVARIGITCALCHTALVEGRPWPGRARRDLEYGRVRLEYHAETRVPLEPELAARMARWGPGRADITGDDDEDPVAIPDLWRLLELSALTQAGTLRLAGDRIADSSERRSHDLVVLAIRQETQIIQASGDRIRPPRELAWALAEFVASLEPPPLPLHDPAGVREGREAFAKHCRRCHDGPAGSGAPVLAENVGTDRALADSRARGTGRFRPAPLVAVEAAAPYFHDGSVATLADVLDARRLTPEYREGLRGPGPVAGHAFGTELPPAERAAIVAYLRTL